MTDEKIVKVGVAIILFKSPEDPRILMGQRRGAHGGGTWSFPGGHLEFGETTHFAAARELREETGIELLKSEFTPVAFTNDVIEGKHYITLFTTAVLFGSEEPKLMEPDKCKGWHWVYTSRLDEMKSYDLFTPVCTFLTENPHMLIDTVRNMRRFARHLREVESK